MTGLSYTVFDTRIGWCGLVWGEHGIVRVVLPGPDRSATLASVRRFNADAEQAEPTADIAVTVERITALMRGERDDLTDVAVDLSGLPEFQRRVWELIRSIPPGETLTYGEVAARLGDPGLARAIGQAMGANPVPIIVPCHRVTGAGGKTGGFSAPGGAVTKLRMLAIEGAAPGGQESLF